MQLEKDYYYLNFIFLLNSSNIYTYDVQLSWKHSDWLNNNIIKDMKDLRLILNYSTSGCLILALPFPDGYDSMKSSLKISTPQLQVKQGVT